MHARARDRDSEEGVGGSDDWLRTLDGSGTPTLETPAPVLPAAPLDAQRAAAASRADFDGKLLPIDFQWLRSPYPEELFSLTERPGYLRLFGRETIGSIFRQSLVARRQQSHCYSASTALEFEPAHFQQSAGLVCYYNSAKFHYLHVSHDEEHGRHVRVMTCTPDSPQADAFTAPIAIPPGRIELRVEVDLERMRFAYRVGAGSWKWLPELFDASVLSDEATAPGAPNFTGAFVGMACQDMSGTAHPADFDFFEYREREYQRAVE